MFDLSDIQDYINTCNEEIGRINKGDSESREKIKLLTKDISRHFERKVELEDRISTLEEIKEELFGACEVSDAKITPYVKTVFRYEGFVND